jgi:DeoR/GlpR family transcriptional regulator of sugar metabolism
MLPAERQRRILAMLAEHGSVRTVEVAAALGVTNETVRKDFETLEERHELMRVHGGATARQRARKELAWSERQSIRRKEKRAIARHAASLIQPEETIFLDASSTVLTLCEFLPDVPLTIITNAHNVFTALENRPHFDLICTGGRYDAKSRSYLGLMAEDTLRRFHIDRMFFSGNGIDIERGVSESNSRQAHFKERVIRCSEQIVLLADHTKTGVKSSFFFAGIGDLSLLVTDTASNPAFLEELEQHDVEVEVAR